MGLKSRIARLEQAMDHSTPGLVMPNGRTVRVAGDELLDCLLASMLGEEHPLLVVVRGAQVHGDGNKILRLIHSFDGQEHREFMQSFRRGGLACAAQP